MDFPKIEETLIIPKIEGTLSIPDPSLQPSMQHSLHSLMKISDSMEALLPPDLTLDTATSTITTSPPLDPILLPPLPVSPSTPSTSLITFSTTPDNSPCAIRDTSQIFKPRKTTRKPKTYSKPVASRFCHICSRMPRRGQGSATCRRMAEGYCRKIVCEQCLREQGWNYEDIISNPANWLCPHCADICPPRSQCHIYNRINARRKRAPPKQHASVAAALASTDLLLGPYAHLLGNPGQQILQPPPNFRLNLPPQYTQH